LARWVATLRGGTTESGQGAAGEPVNQVEPYAAVLRDITPWSGELAADQLADFTGALTAMQMTGPGDPRFRIMSGSTNGQAATRLPTIADGEVWFEALNWVLAAREARERFVMMTLGSFYGAQIVSAYKMLQRLNPMPCKLVAVDAAPENCELTRQNLAANGIAPESYWLVPHALSSDVAPVLFPVGAPRSGARNAISTNDRGERQQYVDMFTREGPERTEAALRNLLLDHTTGITREIEDVAGARDTFEIKLVSAITLAELLAPFDRIDYIEADIQQSEIVVFPPFIELLRQKVHRIHIGTHGREVHAALHDLFAAQGWRVIFSFRPDDRHDTALGSFATGDGVLTVVNPDV
jgi:hypothetical protein